MPQPMGTAATGCPPWCISRHGEPEGKAGGHVSVELVVRGAVVRLSAPSGGDAATGTAPVILVGSEVYTLYEAETLLAALSQLLSWSDVVSPRAGGATRSHDP